MTNETHCEERIGPDTTTTFPEGSSKPLQHGHMAQRDSRKIHVFSKSSLNRLLLDCVALLGMDICSMGLLSCSLRGKHCIFMAVHGQTSNGKKGTGSPHGLHKEEMGHEPFPSPPFFSN